MAQKSYYVVEARLPIEISEALSVDDAARKAAKILQYKFGIDVSNWFLRVFEYGGDEDTVGVIAEYFSNPAGTKFRKVDGNVTKHEEIFEKELNSQGDKDGNSN